MKSSCQRRRPRPCNPANFPRAASKIAVNTNAQKKRNQVKVMGSTTSSDIFSAAGKVAQNRHVSNASDRPNRQRPDVAGAVIVSSSNASGRGVWQAKPDAQVNW